MNGNTRNVRDELLFIDVDYVDDYNFGYDEVYDSFPCAFPTVRVFLESREGLCKLADDMRKADGYLPFFDYSGDYDDNGWYDFSIDLNGYNKHHVDTVIFATAINGFGDTEQTEYMIELSDEEQEYIYEQLNEEIDCEELLRGSAYEHEQATGEKLTILEKEQRQ